MSKKPKVVASYGDPKKSKRWPAKRIRREFAKEILDADRKPPEATFGNIEDMMAWLDKEPDDLRRDCPWKCPGPENCLCVRLERS